MRKIPQLLLLFWFIFMGHTAGSQTILGGVINTDTTLTITSSPYLVTSNLLVAQGVTLTIDPGVIIRFADEKLIQVDGTLRAIGTANDPIIFKKDQNSQTGWGGFRISPTAVDYDTLTGTGTIISHAAISGTYSTLLTTWQYTQIIWCIQSSPLIEYTDISCSQGGLFFDNSSAIFRNNVVHDLVGGVFMTNPYYPPNLNDRVLAENNHFYNWSFPSFPGSVAFDFLGGCLFRKNCVDGILSEMALRVRYPRVRVINNEIKNCGEIGLAIQGGYDSSQAVSYNTFVNNWIHLLLPSCAVYTQITGNNLNSYFFKPVVVDPFYYPFLNELCPSLSYFSLDMQGNYWGALTTSAQIESAITDYNDDFLNVVDIDFTNFLVNPLNIPPVTACNETGLNCTTLVVGSGFRPDNWTVYPIPASEDELYVEGLSEGPARFCLTDLQGRIVQEWQIETASAAAIRLGLNITSAGTYILTLTQSDITTSKKVILH